MQRTKAYKRHKDYVKAKRKQRIASEIYSNHDEYGEGYPYYNNLHQYSKNKIHCSCAMCRRKTKNKGSARAISGNYSPSYNPKLSEVRKNMSMDYEELDVLLDEKEET